MSASILPVKRATATGYGRCWCSRYGSAASASHCSYPGMKIGYIATSIWRSVHLDMAKALQSRGHQVIVYTEDASIPEITSFARRIEDGVEIYGIHHEKRNPWLWLPDRLFKPLLGRRFFTTLFAIYRFLRLSRCDI